MRNLKTITLFLACYILALSLSYIVKAQNKDVHFDSDSAIIDSIFVIVNNSLINRDETLFSREELISLGIDINTLALNYETLNAILEGQSGYVEDYKVQLKDHKIILSENSREARYFIKYSCSFYVYPFNFTVDEVWESGLLKRIDGKWLIFHQHASVPITNDVWPAYLAKKKAITDPFYEYSSDELLEDYDLLTLALEQAHGRLYKFNPQEQYNKQKANIKKQLYKPMDGLEYYKMICPMIASIKCGHTGISPSPQILENLKGQYIYFPFRLKFINGKVFILKGVEDDLVKNGSELISINNRKVDDIVSEIFGMIVSDGEVITGKYKKLDEGFHRFYAEFIQQTEKFKIEYIPYNATKPEIITIKGVDYKKWNDTLNSNNKSNNLLEIKLLDNSNIAILTIRKFVSQEIDELHGSFKTFMDSAFNQINNHNVQNLIIDLRGNGGGNIAHELLPYLIDKPFKFWNKPATTPNTRYSFLEHTDKGLYFNEVHTKLWNKYKNEEGRYELLGSIEEYIEPNAFTYKGKLFVLIDGNSFSGTSNISAVLKDLNRATFFGEETGGCIYGANGGDYINLTLPNTQVKITIPIRSGVNNISANNNLNRGVIPDYEITNGISDILNGKDSEMEFVINYIKENKFDE
jgi:hypothetical protein